MINCMILGIVNEAHIDNLTVELGPVLIAVNGRSCRFKSLGIIGALHVISTAFLPSGQFVLPEDD